jgi:hypothetical protein
MGGVVRVPEADGRDDPLDDVEQILLSAFPDFARREGRGGMSDEEGAQPLAHLRVPNQRLNALGEVDDLFQISGGDPEQLRHTRLRAGL